MQPFYEEIETDFGYLGLSGFDTLYLIIDRKSSNYCSVELTLDKVNSIITYFEDDVKKLIIHDKEIDYSWILEREEGSLNIRVKNEWNSTVSSISLTLTQCNQLFNFLKIWRSER